MNWDQMVKIEPRLKTLFRAAKDADRSHGHECANEIWYAPGGMKEELCALVGFDAENPALSSCECYDIAYQKIYWELPDCEHCSYHGERPE